MTERLARATQRIENLHQLDQVMTAMRGIAASRAQQAGGMLPGVRAYAAVVGQAIGQALALAPPPQHGGKARAPRAATILFCAEQGFAGAFSERMLAAAGTAAGPRDLFLIGTRGRMLAEERRIGLAWHTAMVPQASLVATLAGRIAEALYAWIADRAGPEVDMIVPAWSAAGGVVAQRQVLLPFDFRRFAVPARRPPPLITLPPALLLARLAEEYVFAELCEAALGAFAAENEARVAAMLAARGNLQEMQADLQGLARQIRQEEITAELVELASGAAARLSPGA